jgi:RHS repeat-associated protein
MRIVIQNPTNAANSGSIEFVYDATGVKLKKIIKNSSGTVLNTYDYVNGVEYKDRILQRVSHSEGAVVRNDFGQYQQEYVLRDHLGNTRVTFRDGVYKGEPYIDWNTWSYVSPDNTGYDDGVVTVADMKQINHYYPFGMAMEGDWNGAGRNNNNQYLYNGKQYNDDLGMGWYDYGARWYDPSIARWSAIDPKSEKFNAYSPYNYTLNNPIRFIDPDGMAAAEPPNGQVSWRWVTSVQGSDGKHYETINYQNVSPDLARIYNRLNSQNNNQGYEVSRGTHNLNQAGGSESVGHPVPNINTGNVTNVDTKAGLGQSSFSVPIVSSTTTANSPQTISVQAQYDMSTNADKLTLQAGNQTAETPQVLGNTGSPLTLNNANLTGGNRTINVTINPTPVQTASFNSLTGSQWNVTISYRVTNTAPVYSSPTANSTRNNSQPGAAAGVR